MKRDLILIAQIFQILMELPYTQDYQPVKLELENFSKAKIDYHIKLLEDFEMIETMLDETGRKLPSRIKWKGHNYIQESSCSFSKTILAFFK